MNTKLLDIFFEKIKKDCFQLIEEKKVDIYQLSFTLGVSPEAFMEFFRYRIKDVSFYLKAYDSLLKWR